MVDNVLSQRRMIGWSILILALALCAEACGYPALKTRAEETTQGEQTPKAETSALSTASASAAHTYYVDGAEGSDANPGISRDQAWRTIQKAATTMAGHCWDRCWRL